jgi:hypothetical protein
MKLNLNDTVKLKIKPKGFEILRHEHEDLRKTFPKMEPFIPPANDAEGYHHMQLWRVMELFGPHIHIGFDAPIETELILPPNVK